MGFNDRPFDVFVILGNPHATPVWTASMWVRIAALIDPLVVAARNRAAVRTSQLRRGAGSPNQRSISFGRIGWNENGHRKWIHPDPVAGESEDGVEFVSTEVWAPSWTVCEKEQRAPDMFFGFRNEASFGGKLAFNPYIILAVAADQSEEVCAAGRASAIGIAEHTAAVLRAHRRRNWGYLANDPEHENAIADWLVCGLFRAGPVHSWDVTLDIFAQQWASF
jgi:hypothetical protein